MAEITKWVKKIWKNRTTEFPTRRTLMKEDGSSEIVTVTRNEGTVSEEGDAFDADTMNNLEERIDAGFAELNGKLSNTPSLEDYCGDYTLQGTWSCGNWGGFHTTVSLNLCKNIVDKLNISVTLVQIGYYDKNNETVPASTSIGDNGDILAYLPYQWSDKLRDYTHGSLVKVTVSLKE